MGWLAAWSVRPCPAIIGVIVFVRVPNRRSRPDVSIMQTNLFISRDLADQVKRVFNSRANPGDFGQIKRDALAHLFEDDWSRYDDIYLSLYALSLSKEKNWRASGIADGEKVEFQTLLDLELIDATSDLSAPDEFAVHDLMRFRARLLEILPAGSQLVEVGVGCALLGFSVPVSDDYKKAPLGFTDFGNHLKRYLLDNGWRRLERRFSVADYELK